MRFYALLVAVAALCLSPLTQAEQIKKLGNWDIHYMALSSTFISPQMARLYQLKRSRYTGLVNISVLDNSQPDKPPQDLKVSGQIKDLMGRTQRLDFRQVKEDNAIYYLAQFDYRNEDIYHINITVDDGKRQESFTFTQKFYVD